MLTIMGLYNYRDGLFENMRFPEGFTADDKALTINNILLDCAELELLYPSWDMMHTVIPMWSGIELPVWERIYRASQEEYNPIENYNRTEISTVSHEKTEQHSGTDTKTVSGTDTEANTGTDTLTVNRSETHSGKDSTEYDATRTDADTGHNITENSITAYDSGNLYLHDKSDLSLGKTTTETDIGTSELTHGETIANTGTEATQHGHNINRTSSGSESIGHGEKIDDSGEVTTESHISGNIGVTTSQQMLEQELQIAPKLNIIHIIADSFKQRFCLLVY